MSIIKWFKSLIPETPTRVGWVVIRHIPEEVILFKTDAGGMALKTDSPLWFCHKLGYCVREGENLYESYEDARIASLQQLEHRISRLLKIRDSLKQA